MCGIVGVVLKHMVGFGKRQEDSFFDLLYVDALRGWDSTGLLAVERSGQFHMAKEACEANFFNYQIRQNTIVSKDMWNNGKAYIGHNRKKTVGAIADETAHPFVIDNTFGMVHNGTLNNHEALAKTTVDSEALAIVLKKAFQEKDWKTALEETLGKVYGAYAVAGYDQQADKVFLLRNKERPLSIFETPEAYYFGSESFMVQWILSRTYDLKDMTFHKIDEHELVTFDLFSGKMEKVQLTPKKATPPVTTTPNTGGSKRLFGKTVKTKKDGVTTKEFNKIRHTFRNKRTYFWE
jgi:glucosamine 6-phosphate synthetase-like amidotransferase/phosphosugar isomerase protein